MIIILVQKKIWWLQILGIDATVWTLQIPDFWPGLKSPDRVAEQALIQTWRDWSTRPSVRTKVSQSKTLAILGARDPDEGDTFNEVFNALERPKIRYSWNRIADSMNVIVRFSFPTTATSEETIEYTIHENKLKPVTRRRYKRLFYEVMIHLSPVEGQPR